jgi:hypothetical protein
MRPTRSARAKAFNAVDGISGFDEITGCDFPHCELADPISAGRALILLETMWSSCA